MTDLTAPTFRELPDEEARALLARNNVGRLAFSFHDRVDIEPINYAFDGDWLFMRTSAGTKLTTIAHHPWVAFEVDEVRGQFDWQSVVVRGAMHRLDAEGSPAQRATHARAVEQLRTVVPSTLRAGDPVPFRDVLLGLHLDEITGRGATPGR
jgi:nitroimidazol reductase NimA-like FMN-containing flavoprotein (pyridoxamine 5'-phosphate oxidase superfamily)